MAVTNTVSRWSARQDYSNLAGKGFGASVPLWWQCRCRSSPCVSVQVLQEGGPAISKSSQPPKSQFGSQIAQNSITTVSNHLPELLPHVLDCKK